MQYQNRTNLFLEIILNSTNIADLIHRITSVNSLFQSDTDIMDELQATQIIIEEEKAQLEIEKDALEEKQDELVARRSALEKEQAVLENQQEKLLEQQASLQESQSQKGEALDRLEENLSQVQNNITATNAEIAEQARVAARLLEEQRAAASQAAQNSQPASPPPTQSAGGNQSGPAHFTGRFNMPVGGSWRMTSGFGPRIHPVTGVPGFHRGLDFVSNSPNIYAIADGTVVFSGWASGYGNYIVIQHDATTFSGYGHNRANLVRVGDTVSAGQVIAFIGNTGVSSGPHLHLNIMLNTTNFWNGHVNPAPLLGI